MNMAWEKKIIAHVKDEGAYLNAMTSPLKFAVYCELFGLDKKFQSIWFGPTFSKACQYGKMHHEKKFAKTLDMFPLNLLDLISKNA